MTTMMELFDIEPDPVDGKIHLTREQYDFLREECNPRIIGVEDFPVTLCGYEVVKITK